MRCASCQGEQVLSDERACHRVQPVLGAKGGVLLRGGARWARAQAKYMFMQVNETY